MKNIGAIILTALICSCSSTKSIEAIQEWSDECRQGDSSSCDDLKDSCEAGNEAACSALGYNKQVQERRDEHFRKFQEFNNAIVSHLEKLETTKAKIENRNYSELARSCDNLDPEACATFKYDCDHGSSQACLVIARKVSSEGRSRESAWFFRKACGHGDNDACIKAEQIDTLAQQRDAAEAQEYSAMRSATSRPADLSPAMNFFNEWANPKQPQAQSFKANCRTTSHVNNARDVIYTTECN